MAKYSVWAVCKHEIPKDWQAEYRTTSSRPIMLGFFSLLLHNSNTLKTQDLCRQQPSLASVAKTNDKKEKCVPWTFITFAAPAHNTALNTDAKQLIFSSRFLVASCNVKWTTGLDKYKEKYRDYVFVSVLKLNFHIYSSCAEWNSPIWLTSLYISEKNYEHDQKGIIYKRMRGISSMQQMDLVTLLCCYEKVRARSNAKCGLYEKGTFTTA